MPNSCLEIRVRDRRNGAASDHTFTCSTIRIGRDPGCELHLDDPFVSKEHAVLETDERGARLIDLGGTNGLRVAGLRLAPHSAVLVGERTSVGLGPFDLEVIYTPDRDRQATSGALPETGPAPLEALHATLRRLHTLHAPHVAARQAFEAALADAVHLLRSAGDLPAARRLLAEFPAADHAHLAFTDPTRPRLPADPAPRQADLPPHNLSSGTPSHHDHHDPPPRHPADAPSHNLSSGPASHHDPHPCHPADLPPHNLSSGPAPHHGHPRHASPPLDPFSGPAASRDLPAFGHPSHGPAPLDLHASPRASLPDPALDSSLDLALHASARASLPDVPRLSFRTSTPAAGPAPHLSLPATASPRPFAGPTVAPTVALIADAAQALLPDQRPPANIDEARRFLERLVDALRSFAAGVGALQHLRQQQARDLGLTPLDQQNPLLTRTAADDLLADLLAWRDDTDRGPELLDVFAVLNAHARAHVRAALAATRHLAAELAPLTVDRHAPRSLLRARARWHSFLARYAACLGDGTAVSGTLRATFRAAYVDELNHHGLPVAP